MTTKIAILGTGAFGTALGCVSARNNIETMIWGRSEQVCQQINSVHKNNKYLGSITLPKGLIASTNLQQTIKNAQIILVALPAQKIGDAAKLLAQIEQTNKTALKSDIVLCAKGIDQQTSKLPSQTFLEHFPNARISSLSGPSFAKDIASNLPTAITLASKDIQTAEALAQKLSDNAFRLYASDDIIGVELGGALKNIIAVSLGVCRSLNLGASAEAALIARGFAELSRLASHLGAKRETLAGLSGLGDLVLTCSSPQSRNFSYGLALGKNQDLSTLPLAEGAFSATITNKIAIENGINCPIIAAVAKLVTGEVNPNEAVQQLLNRPLKPEIEAEN